MKPELKALPLSIEEPPHPHENLRLQQKLKNVVWGTIVTILLTLALVALVQPIIWQRVLVNIGIHTFLGALALTVSRFGRPRMASAIFVLGMIILISLQSLQTGGLHSPGISSFFILCLLAALLLGWRWAVGIALLCAGINLGLALIEALGALPPPRVHYTPFAYALIRCAYIGLMVVLIRAIVNDLKEALTETKVELKERLLAQRRLQMALDAGGIGIWEKVKVPDSGFRGDKRVFDILGQPMTANRVIDLDSWLNSLHPEDREKVEAKLHEMDRTSTQTSFDYRLTWPDGQLRYLHVEGVNLGKLDDIGAEVVGVVIDVTEQTRLLANITERMKELRLLHSAALLLNDRPLDQACLATLVAEMPSAWQWPDVCQARISIGDIVVATPGWRESLWMMSAPFGPPGASGLIEVAYLEERPTAAEGSFLAEERELINSVAQFLTSSMLREQAERQRRQVEQKLRQAQKMEALGTMAGGVAHDFNNLLTVIKGYCEISMIRLKSDDPTRQAFEAINQAGDRATDLVKSILTYSRRHESKKSVIALESLLNDVLKLLEMSLPKNVRVSLKCSPQLPKVNADLGQMHQVLMNFGVNAGHAMMPAGGRLSIELDTVELDSPLEGSSQIPAGRYVRICVEDTGSGMPPEIMEKIFDPFFSTKGDKGTGLGLSIVYGIIRDHEGHISVTSEVGKGTAFRILLPAHEEESVPDSRSALSQA